MESENIAGASDTTQAEAAEPKQGIKQLAELLAQDGEHEAGPTGQVEPRERQGAKKAPKKFNDLAEQLGVELDALYKLEISQAQDGEPVTIERLKDFYTKQGEHDLERIAWEERRTEEQAELLRAQTELRELLGALPPNAVKPEFMEKIRSKHEQQIKIEKARTLEVIPEWRDSERRESEIRSMVQHLTQYGFAENYLGQVADHKLLKYFRDSWQREARIRKALDLVRSGRPDNTPSPRPQQKAPKKAPVAGAPRKTRARNKLEAVFNQLDN